MDKQSFLEKLKRKHPSTFESNSYELLPETFLAHDKIEIVCSIHGKYTQKAYQHLAGGGCPTCGRIKSDKGRVKTTSYFVERSKERYGARFDYSKTEYQGQDRPLILTCVRCGDIKLTPREHFWNKGSNRYGCRKCNYELPRQSKSSSAIEKAKEVHGNTYDYSKVVYKNVNERVEIICRKHGSFWQSLSTHLAGSRCPKCVREEEKLTIEEFIEKSKKLFGDQYDYSRVTLEFGTNVKMPIGCKKHGIFIQRLNSHLQGNGCKKCYRESTRNSTEDFIEAAQMVHGDRYDYSKVVYHGNKKPVEIVCPQHGSFFQKPNSHVCSRTGCPKCHGWSGEREIGEMLMRLGISYQPQYRIKPYRYRFDFYLPEFNIFIEFNGRQHYEPIPYFGGQKSFEGIRKRDGIKRQLVRKANGVLIVLKYSDQKENLLEKRMIQKLRSIYNRWYLIDGKIQVFKKVTDVYNYFKIDKDVLIRDLDSEVGKKVSNFSVLF